MNRSMQQRRSLDLCDVRGAKRIDRPQPPGRPFLARSSQGSQHDHCNGIDACIENVNIGGYSFNAEVGSCGGVGAPGAK